MKGPLFQRPLFPFLRRTKKKTGPMKTKPLENHFFWGEVDCYRTAESTQHPRKIDDQHRVQYLGWWVLPFS